MKEETKKKGEERRLLYKIRHPLLAPMPPKGVVLQGPVCEIGKFGMDWLSISAKMPRDKIRSPKLESTEVREA